MSKEIKITLQFLQAGLRLHTATYKRAVTSNTMAPAIKSVVVNMCLPRRETFRFEDFIETIHRHKETTRCCVCLFLVWVWSVGKSMQVCRFAIFSGYVFYALPAGCPSVYDTGINELMMAI